MSGRANTFELVLIEIANATDGAGRRINLLPHIPGRLPDAADFRKSICYLTRDLDENTVFLDGIEAPERAGPQAERAFVRNLELLTRGWLECLAFEEAKR